MADATGYISAMKNSSDSDIAERFAKIGTFLKYYQLSVIILIPTYKDKRFDVEITSLYQQRN